MPVLKRQASAYLSNMKFNTANIRIYFVTAKKKREIFA